MRQHAILSCLVLLFGWGLFFGVPLFQSINAVSGWTSKILLLSVIPLCLCVVTWHRQKCRRIIFRTNIWGFLGLLGLLALRLYAVLTQQQEWQLLSILWMIPFIILASLGFRAWWAWCFPSLAVVFAYPGWCTFAAWLQAKMLVMTKWVFPWSALALSGLDESGRQIVPLSDFSMHWMVITAFYGYLRYQPFAQRLLFYGLSATVFFAMACIQACGLSGLLYWGGNALLSQFNLFQLNQILAVLGICFLGYALSILAPYKPPLRRMMNENTDFIILVDRHSHWLLLTIAALGIMAVSVWLGNNIHQMSLPLMEIWR